MQHLLYDAFTIIVIIILLISVGSYITNHLALLMYLRHLLLIPPSLLFSPLSSLMLLRLPMSTFFGGSRAAKALVLLLELHTLINILLASLPYLTWVLRCLTLVHLTISLVTIIFSIPFPHPLIYLSLLLPMEFKHNPKALAPHIPFHLLPLSLSYVLLIVLLTCCLFLSHSIS